jgi:hypothetical protein
MAKKRLFAAKDDLINKSQVLQEAETLGDPLNGWVEVEIIGKVKLKEDKETGAYTFQEDK